MKAEDYHTLINRGWRRCGTDYYKPNTEECNFYYKYKVVNNIDLII